MMFDAEVIKLHASEQFQLINNVNKITIFTEKPHKWLAPLQYNHYDEMRLSQITTKYNSPTAFTLTQVRLIVQVTCMSEAQTSGAFTVTHISTNTCNSVVRIW